MTAKRDRRPVKILLADADADFRKLLCLYLAFCESAVPIEARDGEELLEKAFIDRPDLIIMEIVLPKKNGFQVAQELRGDPLTRSITIFAATAMADPKDRERCLACGFDAYLAKPFSRRDFMDLLCKHLPT